MNIRIMSRDDTLIFLHLPKAGGMTLHFILEQRYPRERIFTFDGTRPHQSVERFQKMSEAQRAEYRLLKGHVVYGVHRAVPRPCTYITLLRDPVERVISQYYYAKSRPEHHLYARLNQPGMTLYEYAAQFVTPEISNQQTSMLAGIRVSESQQTPARELVALAKEHLETHFRVVGLMEEFDTSMLLLQRAFGWSRLFYLRENVAREKPAPTQIDVRTRELLAEQNALDAELYVFARELFERQCRAYGDNLARDLAQFQKWNALYQRVVGPLTQFRKRAGARLVREQI